MPYQTIEVRPAAGSLGAEVHGVDLASPPSNATVDELRRAFVEHLVLFFRDQNLTPEQHLEFSRLFGPLSRVPYVKQCLEGSQGVLVAASDYLKTLPNMISKWMPRRLATLGTDGFGRSEGRTSLREFFEVDSRFITLATLHELYTDGQLEKSVLDKAFTDLAINPDKPNPVIS